MSRAARFRKKTHQKRIFPRLGGARAQKSAYPSRRGIATTYSDDPMYSDAPKDIDARVRHLIARGREGRFFLTSLLSRSGLKKPSEQPPLSNMATKKSESREWLKLASQNYIFDQISRFRNLKAEILK